MKFKALAEKLLASVLSVAVALLCCVTAFAQPPANSFYITYSRTGEKALTVFLYSEQSQKLMEGVYAGLTPAQQAKVTGGERVELTLTARQLAALPTGSSAYEQALGGAVPALVADITLTCRIGEGEVLPAPTLAQGVGMVLQLPEALRGGSYSCLAIQAGSVAVAGDGDSNPGTVSFTFAQSGAVVFYTPVAPAAAEPPKVASQAPAATEPPKVASQAPAAAEPPKVASQAPAAAEPPKVAPQAPAAAEPPKVASQAPAAAEPPKVASQAPAIAEPPKVSPQAPAVAEPPKLPDQPITGGVPDRLMPASVMVHPAALPLTVAVTVEKFRYGALHEQLAATAMLMTTALVCGTIDYENNPAYASEEDALPEEA